MASNNTAVDMNAIKTFVGAALHIPESLWGFWDVIDLYPADAPRLALAHYNEQFDHYNRAHEPLRKIRGTIVDLATGAVVCDSYGYTQTLPLYAPLDEFASAENPAGSILVQTEMGTYFNPFEIAPEEPAKLQIGTLEFNKANSRLSLGYEGVLIRIFKWNGQVFVSTHRRIDGSRSKWGGRDLFINLYQKLGGPDPASLFGEEPFSPYCHQFLVVDNEIRLATSTRDNRILYLGVKQLWDVTLAAQGGPYFWSGDFELRVPAVGAKPEPPVFSQDLNRSMFQQQSVDVATANKFVFPHSFAPRVPSGGEAAAYGAKENEIVLDYTPNGTVNEVFFNPASESIFDERLNGGDFLILYTQLPNGETIVYRLEPAAFEYRIMVTGNDPNFYHRFVVEMVQFTKGNPADLLEKYPRYADASGRLDLSDVTNRQTYWWSLFYGAVAPAFKDEVEKYFTQYGQDIKKVAHFITHEFQNVHDEEEKKRINENTARRFTDLYRIAADTAARERRSPFGVIVSLLYKETGPSLYKMITTVRNIEKFRKTGMAPE